MTYEVKDEMGCVLDATHSRSPVICRIGCGEIPDGLEKAIIGLRTGDKRTFTICPEQAYGERKKDLIIRVRQSELPDDDGKPAVGKKYRRLNTLMETEVYQVVGYLGKWIFLDANHPFSGITLQYDVVIVDVKVDNAVG